MQLVQFFIFSFFMSFLVIFPSIFGPSNNVVKSASIYFFFTFLSSEIRCKWPNQLNLLAFTLFIMFLCLINLSNTSFVLILHITSLSFVGSKIFRSTFLSNTINYKTTKNLNFVIDEYCLFKPPHKSKKQSNLRGKLSTFYICILVKVRFV